MKTTYTLAFTCLFALCGYTQEKKAEVVNAQSIQQVEKQKLKAVSADETSPQKVDSKAKPKKEVKQQNSPQKLSVGTKKNNAVKKTDKRTLADVERDIKNIETKMEYVKNNPEENATAKEEGWYDKMNKRLKRLYTEKEKYQNKK